MISLADFVGEATEFISEHAKHRDDSFEWGVGSDVIPFFYGVDDDHTAVAKARDWARTRYDAGFGGVSGPEEFGGRALPLPYDLAHRVLESEYDVADTSHLDLGWGMVGPTVLAWTSEESRARSALPGRPRRLPDVQRAWSRPAATANTEEWGTYAWSEFLLGTPALRILGGTEEIMKNILAERVLGLPKSRPEKSS